MPDLAALVSETYHNISPGYLETLFQARREELFTGLMRLHRSPGENLVFTFLEGIQKKLYRCFENTTELIPRHSWLDVLDHANASVGFLHLPVEGMHFVRVAYEAPVLRVETSTVTSERLKDSAEKWAADDDPGIVHVQSETINRFYLIAGHASPIIEELAFVDEPARFSIAGTSFPQALPKGDYRVVRFVSNREHEVWREYELRLAFNPLMHMLLSRFGELAGRVLTERLCQQLSLWAREGGWNITITSNGALNRHYFDSLENAIEAYVDLLRRFRQEASPAIGARMMDGISREVLMKLDPYRRELLTQCIYSQYGVGGVAGVVWR
jgi:hypothetical protein